MDRAEFFSHIKNTFTDAAKEAISPIIEDDLQKIDSVIDEFAGYKWYDLGEVHFSPFNEVVDKFINNHSINLYSVDSELKAVSKLCSNCGSIVNWLSYEKKFKCFKCESEFSLKSEEGKLKLREYRLKLGNGRYSIALD